MNMRGEHGYASPADDLLLFHTLPRRRSYKAVGLRHRIQQWPKSSSSAVATSSSSCSATCGTPSDLHWLFPSSTTTANATAQSSTGRMSANAPFQCDKSHQSDASLASSWTSFSSDEETDHSTGHDVDSNASISVGEDVLDPRNRRTIAGLPIPLLLCCIVSLYIFLFQVCPLITRAVVVTDLVAASLGPPPPLWTLEPPHDVDALVFVALGPKAISPAFTWSVNSAVQVGGWNGPVFVVTDDQEAAQTVFKENEDQTGLHPKNLHIVQPMESSDLHVDLQLATDEVTYKARLTKCQLLRILPDELRHVLYIDADVMIGKPLRPLLSELSMLWNDPDQNMEMALFPDCKAFSAGFSLDCDTWNTGVMSLRRNSSEACMDKWCEALTEHAGSDQAALDHVITQGFCQDIRSMDHKQHLRMMKDVFVLLGLVPEKTFNHFTQLFRPRNLALFHQWFYSHKLGRDVHKLVPSFSSAVERSYFAK